MSSFKTLPVVASIIITPVGNENLIELARNRLRNVKSRLIESGIPESRIYLNMEISLDEEVLNRPSARVDLDLLKGKRKPL